MDDVSADDKPSTSKVNDWADNDGEFGFNSDYDYDDDSDSESLASALEADLSNYTTDSENEDSQESIITSSENSGSRESDFRSRGRSKVRMVEPSIFSSSQNPSDLLDYPSDEDVDADLTSKYVEQRRTRLDLIRETKSLNSVRSLQFPVTIRGIFDCYLHHPIYLRVNRSGMYFFSKSEEPLSITRPIKNLSFNSISEDWLNLDYIISTSLSSIISTEVVSLRTRNLLLKSMLAFSVINLIDPYHTDENTKFFTKTFNKKLRNLADLRDVIETVLRKTITKRVVDSYIQLDQWRKSQFNMDGPYESQATVTSKIEMIKSSPAIDNSRLKGFLKLATKSNKINFTELMEAVPIEFRENFKKNSSTYIDRIHSRMYSIKGAAGLSKSELIKELTCLNYARYLTIMTKDGSASVAYAILINSIDQLVEPFTTAKAVIIGKLSKLRDNLRDNYQYIDWSELTGLIGVAETKENAISLSHSLNYIKGTLGEFLLCQKHKLRYNIEVSKPSLGELIKRNFGEDKLKKVRDCLVHANKLSSRPDGYLVHVNYVPASSDENTSSSDDDSIMEADSSTDSDVKESDYTYDKLTKSSDAVPEDTKAFKPIVQNEMIGRIILYEFGWVYNIKEKTRTDREFWNDAIIACRMSGIELVVRGDYLNSSLEESFHKISADALYCRTVMSECRRQLIRAMPISEQVISEVNSSIWPETKLMNYNSFHTIGSTRLEFTEVRRQVMKDIEDDPLKRTPKLYDNINKLMSDPVCSDIKGKANLNLGIEFLTSIISKSDYHKNIHYRDFNQLQLFLENYNSGVDEENKPSDNSNYKKIDSYHGIVMRDGLADRLFQDTSKSTKPATHLDILNRLILPNEKSADKIGVRLLNKLKLTISSVKGLSAISFIDGSYKLTRTYKVFDGLLLRLRLLANSLNPDMNLPDSTSDEKTKTAFWEMLKLTFPSDIDTLTQIFSELFSQWSPSNKDYKNVIDSELKKEYLEDDISNNPEHNSGLKPEKKVNQQIRYNVIRFNRLLRDICFAYLEQLSPDEHNSYRSNIISSIIKSKDFHTEPREYVERAYKKLFGKSTELKSYDTRGEIPTKEAALKAVSDLESLFVITNDTIADDNPLYNYLIRMDVLDSMEEVGFIKIYKELITDLTKYMLRIPIFKRMVKMMLICEAFLNIFKRKKGSTVLQSRIKCTKARLYIHRHRNYNESFKCKIISDDGTFTYNLTLNERLSKLWFSLPKMVLLEIANRLQRELKKKPFSLVSSESWNTCVEDFFITVRKSIISFYSPDCSADELNKVDGSPMTERMCRSAIGMLFIGHLRHPASKENNEQASMIRYAILANYSKYMNFGELGKKVAFKFRTVWEFVESNLVKDVVLSSFYRELNSDEAYLIPRLYALGFSKPCNSESVIDSMYNLHMYPKGFNNWEDAVKLAHKSYLKWPIEAEHFSMQSDQNADLVTGYSDMELLFKKWLNVYSQSEKDEIVLKAVKTMERYIDLNKGHACWNNWVVELSARLLKLMLPETTIPTLLVSKELDAPLTNYAEPTSVIRSFRSDCSPYTIATDYTQRRDKQFFNLTSKRTKERFADTGTDYNEVTKYMNMMDPKLAEAIKIMKDFSVKTTLENFNDEVGAFHFLSLCNGENGEGALRLIKGINSHCSKYCNNLLMNRKLDGKKNTRASLRDRVKKWTNDEWAANDEMISDDLNSLINDSPINFYRIDHTDDEFQELDEMCGHLINTYLYYYDQCITHPGAVQVDAIATIKVLEDEIINDWSELLIQVLYHLLFDTAMSNCHIYNRFRINSQSPPGYSSYFDSNLKSIRLSSGFTNVHEFCAKLFLAGSRFSDALTRVGEVVKANEDISKVLRRISLNASPEVTYRDFIVTSSQLMLGKISTIKRNFVNFGKVSALRSLRCKSVEIMGEVMRRFSTTSMFQTATELAFDTSVKQQVGIAPKDQFLGIRELAILHIDTKIMMASCEAISGHILSDIPSDLLRTPKRKGEFLKEFSVAYASPLKRVHFVSGDRSKWGPKHHYGCFDRFFRVLLEDSELCELMRAVLVKGISKQLEIPYPSIQSVVRKLMNCSDLKAHSNVDISRKLDRLFSKLRMIDSNLWMNEIMAAENESEDEFGYDSNEDEYDTEASETGSVSSDVKLGSEEIYETWDTDYILSGSSNELFDLIISYKFSKEQLFVLFYLVHNKISHNMIYHMNQGIPHLTSSVLGNSSLRLAVICYELDLKQRNRDLADNMKIEFITSSDDYAILIICDASMISEDAFNTEMKIFRKFQVMIASAMNIKDSLKTGEGNQLGEVYSVFSLKGCVTPPGIKHRTANLLPNNQSSPLALSQEELTRVSQMVDNACSEFTIFVYQLLKQSQLVNYCQIPEDEFIILSKSSCVTNPTIAVNYDQALLISAELNLISKTLYNSHNATSLRRQIKKTKALTIEDEWSLYDIALFKLIRNSEDYHHGMVASLLDGLIFDSMTDFEGQWTNSGRKFVDELKLKDAILFPNSQKLKIKREELLKISERNKSEELFEGENILLARGGQTKNLRIEMARLNQSLKSEKMAFKLTDGSTSIGYTNLKKSYNTHRLVLRRESCNKLDIIGWSDMQTDVSNVRVHDRYKLLDVVTSLSKLVTKTRNILKTKNLKLANLPGEVIETVRFFGKLLDTQIKTIESITKMASSSVINSARAIKSYAYPTIISEKPSVLLGSRPISHYQLGVSNQVLSNNWAHVACYMINPDSFKSGEVKLNSPDTIETDSEIVRTIVGSPNSDDSEHLIVWVNNVERIFANPKPPTRLTYLTVDNQSAEWSDLSRNVPYNRIIGYHIRTEVKPFDEYRLVEICNTESRNIATYASTIKQHPKVINEFARLALRYVLQPMLENKMSMMAYGTGANRHSFNIDNETSKLIQYLNYDPTKMSEHYSSKTIHYSAQRLYGKDWIIVTNRKDMITLCEELKIITTTTRDNNIVAFLLKVLAANGPNDEKKIKMTDLTLLFPNQPYDSQVSDSAMISEGYTPLKITYSGASRLILRDCSDVEVCTRIYYKPQILDISDKSGKDSEFYSTISRKVTRGGLHIQVTMNMPRIELLLPMAKLTASITKEYPPLLRKAFSDKLEQAYEEETTYSYPVCIIRSQDHVPLTSLISFIKLSRCETWPSSVRQSGINHFRSLLDKGTTLQTSNYRKFVSCLDSIKEKSSISDVSLPPVAIPKAAKIILDNRFYENRMIIYNHEKIMNDLSDYLANTIVCNTQLPFTILHFCYHILGTTEVDTAISNLIIHLQNQNEEFKQMNEIIVSDPELYENVLNEPSSRISGNPRLKAAKELITGYHGISRQIRKESIQFINMINNIEFMPPDIFPHDNHLPLQAISFSNSKITISNYSTGPSLLLSLSSAQHYLNSSKSKLVIEPAEYVSSIYTVVFDRYKKQGFKLHNCFFNIINVSDTEPVGKGVLLKAVTELRQKHYSDGNLMELFQTTAKHKPRKHKNYDGDTIVSASNNSYRSSRLSATSKNTRISSRVLDSSSESSDPFDEDDEREITERERNDTYEFQ